MFVVVLFVVFVTSTFWSDNKSDETYPSFPSTFILLHPFSSAYTSTLVFWVNFTTTSEFLSASFLTLTFVSLIYAVFIGVSVVLDSSWLFASSLFVVVSSVFEANLSFLIQPFVLSFWTHTQPFIVSITVTFSSFFTSIISVEFIVGTIFNLVSSTTICSFVVSSDLFSVFAIDVFSEFWVLLVFEVLVFSFLFSTVTKSFLT